MLQLKFIVILFTVLGTNALARSMVSSINVTMMANLIAKLSNNISKTNLEMQHNCLSFITVWNTFLRISTNKFINIASGAQSRCLSLGKHVLM